MPSGRTGRELRVLGGNWEARGGWGGEELGGIGTPFHTTSPPEHRMGMPPSHNREPHGGHVWRPQCIPPPPIPPPMIFGPGHLEDVPIGAPPEALQHLKVFLGVAGGDAEQPGVHGGAPPPRDAPPSTPAVAAAAARSWRPPPPPSSPQGSAAEGETEAQPMGTRASGGGPPVPNHSAGRGTPTEALRGRGAARPHGIPVRPNAPHDDLDPIFSPSGLSSAPFTPVSPSGPPEDRTRPQHGTVRLWNVPIKALSDPPPSPTSVPFTPICPTAACSTPGSLTLPSRARCAPLPPSPTPWLLFQSPSGCGCALTSL